MEAKINTRFGKARKECMPKMMLIFDAGNVRRKRELIDPGAVQGNFLASLPKNIHANPTIVSGRGANRFCLAVRPEGGGGCILIILGRPMGRLSRPKFG